MLWLGWVLIACLVVAVCTLVIRPRTTRPVPDKTVMLRPSVPLEVGASSRLARRPMLRTRLGDADVKSVTSSRRMQRRASLRHSFRR
jgi:hypothetical protein